MLGVCRLYLSEHLFFLFFWACSRDDDAVSHDNQGNGGGMISRKRAAFIQTLIDDPSSLTGQLVDSFSNMVSNKRARNGFCNIPLPRYHVHRGSDSVYMDNMKLVDNFLGFLGTRIA
ncbi:hypothetical protein POM88_040931 [Heracleum sosnowskyi]|uniref:VIN3-like C-terminal domain-containing protein n=1 Tax=Heracleum sosnowskyi TaxID=360622 RepID=A0AAD8M7U1_9APIA|nr:hypothetical protein POM88_040931 [Heracleum sosnowskyi]